ANPPNTTRNTPHPRKASASPNHPLTSSPRTHNHNKAKISSPDSTPKSPPPKISATPFNWTSQAQAPTPSKEKPAPQNNSISIPPPNISSTGSPIPWKCISSAP